MTGWDEKFKTRFRFTTYRVRPGRAVLPKPNFSVFSRVRSSLVVPYRAFSKKMRLGPRDGPCFFVHVTWDGLVMLRLIFYYLYLIFIAY